jgi:hypothetical protein
MSANVADQTMPASLDNDKPTLTTLPKELRENILEKLFEDELDPQILDGVIKQFPDWPLAILQTCHLLRYETDRAIQAKLCDCELRYIECAPPFDEADIDAEADDDCDSKHVRFLLNYGDCFETVERYDTVFDGEFPLHWFSHLKDFKLRSLSHTIYSNEFEADIGYGDDKDRLQKARVLERFNQQYLTPGYYDNPLSFGEELIDLIQNTTIGVDRSYTIHFYKVLHVGNLRSWVSLYRPI